MKSVQKILKYIWIMKLYQNGIKVHEKVVDLEKGFQEIELDSYYSNKTI